MMAGTGRGTGHNVLVGFGFSDRAEVSFLDDIAKSKISLGWEMKYECISVYYQVRVLDAYIPCVTFVLKNVASEQSLIFSST